MDETSTYVLTFATALGCGLMAGLFFTFSVFQMRALDRLGPAPAIAAMQSINTTILTPLFLFVFMGSLLASLVLGVIVLVDLEGSERTYVLLGCGLYLVGVMAVTIGYHVPRNNALDAVDPTSPEAPERWARYFGELDPGERRAHPGFVGCPGLAHRRHRSAVVAATRRTAGRAPRRAVDPGSHQWPLGRRGRAAPPSCSSA